MNHNCGICGVWVEKNAENLLYKMLLALQHRGQLSAGITTYHENDLQILRTHKELGTVNTAFRSESKEKFSNIMKRHSSNAGIGHVRYATSGADDKSYAQPFERQHGRKNKWFSFCFNGNIANYKEIKEGLAADNYHLTKETDTELIMHLLSKAIKENEDLPSAFNFLSSHLDGSYNIAFIDAAGNLVAARDPVGFHPLCYSIRGNEVAFASESIALLAAGFTNIKDLEPGHMLIKTKDSFTIKKFAHTIKKAHCFFEWVYFSNPASIIDGSLVYQARHSLGKALAKLETQKIDSNCIVVPVPDSSRPAGEGFAQATGIPCVEGLIRNRYLGRTFIESTDRAQKVIDKFTVIRQVIEGKRIFLIDDSIVRGTTLKNLIAYIKKAGNPKEIHVRVSCPPVMWPCFYGIDMSSRSELIAAKFADSKDLADKVRLEVGADSLIYQTQEGLIDSIGLDKNILCRACINGDYPTITGDKLNSSSETKRSSK